MDDGGVGVVKNIVRGRVDGQVEAGDLGDGNGGGVAREQLDFIAGADLAFAGDGQVETGAGAGKKALHHLVGLETDAQLVARQARLRDNHFRGTDGEAVAEVHRILEQAFGGEVLSENGKAQVAAGKLLFPVRVVFDGIAVNRFVFAAVNAEVGLTVSIEIQLAESEAAGDGLLEDGGGDDGVVPRDFAGEADVEGDELHVYEPSGLARRAQQCCAPTKEKDAGG